MGMVIAAVLIYPTIMVFELDDLKYQYENIDTTYIDLRGNFYRLCPMKGVYHYSKKMPKHVRCTNHDNTMPILLIEFFCTFLLVTMLLNVKYLNGVGQTPITNAATMGAALAAMSHLASPISGACFSPSFAIVQ